MGIDPNRCYFCSEHELLQDMFKDEYNRLRCCDVDGCHERQTSGRESFKTKMKSSMMKSLKVPKRARRYRR